MPHPPSRRALLTSGAAALASTPALASTAAAAPARQRPSSGPTATPGRTTITPGADVAAAQHWSMLRGKKIGVVTNPTGVLRDSSHLVDSLAARQELNVVGVFGPEHGFRGTAQAGGSEDTSKDPRTGLTVYDAYGADTAKLARLFRTAGADTIVFDIQDVGVRFYTYIWTMYTAMAAARDVGAAFWVLDRPNPLGRRVDGPMMTSDYTSGVGLKEIIQQHGLSIGELARYFNGEILPKDHTGGKHGAVDLSVVRVRGWDPHSVPQQYPADANPSWVPPSPNIPTVDSVAVYAGTGYLEGCNLSEGRGTTSPFELVGAPYLNYHYSDRLNARNLPGVRFREAYYVPTTDKYAKKDCAGVQIQVTDHRHYQPIPTAVALLVEARRYDSFAWRKDSGTTRPYWIDKLSGSPRLRNMIDDGKDVDEIVASWRTDVHAFDRTRSSYFLY